MGRKREGRRKGRRIRDEGVGGGIVVSVVVVLVLEIEVSKYFDRR